MTFRPETANAINELEEISLRGLSTLTQAGRGTDWHVYISENDCNHRLTIHGPGAAHYLDGDEELIWRGMHI
jgi:hypothetical protein